MICRLKCSIVDWEDLNIFYKGTIMETVEISDQNIHLTDTRNADKILNLTLEEFTSEDLIEVLEGGV